MMYTPNLIRSSVVPQTIASETAQKTNWKNHFASIVASESPMIGNAFCGSPKSCRNQPVWPMRSPEPNANAKPMAQYMIPAIEKFVRILATTVPAFFPREKPISRNAKPACMNMTTIAATITQVELMPTVSGSLPLPAASKVSASADAGNASATSRPSGSARLKGESSWSVKSTEVSDRRSNLCLSRCRRSAAGFSPLGRGFRRLAKRGPEPLASGIESGGRRRPIVGAPPRTHRRTDRVYAFPPDSSAQRHRRSVERQRRRNGPQRPHGPRCRHLRRERLQPGRAAPAAAQARLQAADQNARHRRGAGPRARRLRGAGDEGVGAREGRHALHALVPAAHRHDRREARLVLQPDRRRHGDRRVLRQGADPGRA